MKKTMAAAIILTTLLILAAVQEDIIDWRTLAEFLPETFNGMARCSDVDGTTVTSGGMAMSSASIEYGDYQASVTIHCGTIASNQFKAFSSMANLNIDSSDGYIRSLEIKGFPAVEQYDNESKKGTVMISLPNGVAVITEMEECENTDICKAVAEAMDLENLATK